MSDAVVIGLGQMGGLFAHALLRAGLSVHPVLRDTDAALVAAEVPEPDLVLVAVGEAELPAVLDTLPSAWRGRVGLLQNELLPPDWRSRGVEDPTVAVVWFEKKKDKPLGPILPTPIAGPEAELLAEALAAVDVPAEVVPREALLGELVVKNLYILTTNVAGLVVGGTTGALWTEHRELAERVARDVLSLQAALAGEPLEDGEALLGKMAEALLADPDHGCRGRTAEARLARALAHAERLGVAVPALREIAGR